MRVKARRVISFTIIFIRLRNSLIMIYLLFSRISVEYDFHFNIADICVTDTYVYPRILYMTEVAVKHPVNAG